LTGLFVFNLGDGFTPKAPLLMAVDLCLQMFLSLLQLVMMSMVWKLRTDDADPPLLAGVQRGCECLGLPS
jgi:hypothetical protein